MPRYFIDVSYIGDHYSGFQKQDNANSIQAELEKAFSLYFRHQFSMTGSSRTDAGVHARQNFFHFDFEKQLPDESLYHINAILPSDIVLNTVRIVTPSAHCRYDALSRDYKYYIYRKKDPFLFKRAFYFPYKMDFEGLNSAADCIARCTDFSSFAKRNSQVKNFQCEIYQSEWIIQDDCWVYHIRANRFLRGMVRGLVGTMLLVGRNKIDLAHFESIIEGRDSSQANFSVPGHGLFLIAVKYPEHLFPAE
jgi:tRNA pseudouridine38-40 synthase